MVEVGIHLSFEQHLSYTKKGISNFFFNSKLWKYPKRLCSVAQPFSIPPKSPVTLPLLPRHLCASSLAHLPTSSFNTGSGRRVYAADPSASLLHLSMGIPQLGHAQLLGATDEQN